MKEKKIHTPQSTELKMTEVRIEVKVFHQAQVLQQMKRMQGIVL